MFPQCTVQVDESWHQQTLIVPGVARVLTLHNHHLEMSASTAAVRGAIEIRLAGRSLPAPRAIATIEMTIPLKFQWNATNPPSPSRG
jgi:hypothetical protein